MKMPCEFRALSTGLGLMLVLAACSQSSPAQPANAPTAIAEALATAETSTDPRFNPTAAAGGGINSSNAISADDLTNAFKAVPQASQLKLTANSSPPGAKGADVQTVSIVGQDGSGVLKSLDPTGKKALGDALLTAATAAWPNASVSLLLSDVAGTGGSIIGSRPPGGANTIIVS